MSARASAPSRPGTPSPPRAARPDTPSFRQALVHVLRQDPDVAITAARDPKAFQHTAA